MDSKELEKKLQTKTPSTILLESQFELEIENFLDFRTDEKVKSTSFEFFEVNANW